MRIFGKAQIVNPAARQKRRATRNRMTLYSYTVRWDHGFAPNPFFGMCTVATCKPKIRKYAKLGDFIIGTGTAERALKGRLVLAMRVTQVITFDDYWTDSKFAMKKPLMNGSLEQRFGDNIYHRENGNWVQADSRHSQLHGQVNLQNQNRDVGTTDRILVSDDFIYWGGDGPKIPSSLGEFVHSHPGHKKNFSSTAIQRFVEWSFGSGKRGRMADPYEWRYEKRWR